MMRLTKQAEIAVRILMLCARPQSNAPVTTRVAAAFAGATKDHAAQVVCRLSRAGYLEATRGRAGGIALARSAARISIGEIVRLIEPPLGSGHRDAGWKVAGSAFDALQRAALEAFIATFDDFTIADLVADPTASRVACLDCELHAVVRRNRPFSHLPERPSHAPRVPGGAHTALRAV